MIFDKRKSEKVIFYNGTNQQEVIDFFVGKEFVAAKFFEIIDADLHYKRRDYIHANKTLIKPNNYIMFKYCEDDWWYIKIISKKEFEENFIEI